MSQISNEIISNIQQIYNIQSYLLNLKLAFQQHPLPANWELRVATDTYIPYWVNHTDRISTPYPPNISNFDRNVRGSKKLFDLFI